MYVQSIRREMIPVSQVANFKVSLGKERPADGYCQLATQDYAAFCGVILSQAVTETNPNFCPLAEVSFSFLTKSGSKPGFWNLVLGVSGLQ